MPDTESQEYIIDSRSRLALQWKELWQYRELFYFFTWRDVKVKYKQTVLGLLWVILQPLLLMLIFTFFFGRVLGVTPEGMSYQVFVFSGILVWTFFSSAVTHAGNSMVSNAGIIKKIYFPRLIIPLSAVLVALVDLIITLIIFLIFLVFTQTTVAFSAFFFWPLAMLLTLIGTIGLGCLISALMVKYRDFRFVVPFALQIAFFVAPIVYPVSRIELPLVKYMLAINPVYGSIILFRAPLMQTGTIDTGLVCISSVSALFMLICGLLYFRKTELFFADVA